MARTVDPFSWPFAVSPRHPSQIPFWLAMVLQTVNLISHLTGGGGLPTWTLAVTLALMIGSAVAARVANAKARRLVQPSMAGRG